MENIENNSTVGSNGKSKKLMTSIIVLIIVIIGAIWLMSTSKEIPKEEIYTEESIDQNLKDINLDSGIDAELDGLDTEINTL